MKPAGKPLAALSLFAAGWRAAALAFSLLALLLLISGLPFSTVETNRILSHTVGPLLFLLAAAFLASRSGRRATYAPERRFWRLLAAGYGIWSATYVPSLISRLAPDGVTFILPYLDFGFALSFLFVVAAVEQRPDDHSPLTELGRRPSLWHTTLLMTGFFSTLVLLPALYNRQDYPTYLSSFGFFVAMDLAVAARLFYFASQAESLRWRVIYGSVGLGFTLMVGVDLATGLLRRHNAPLTAGAFYDALWTLPFLVMVISAASGLLELDDRRSGAREPTLSDAFAASTLTWALVFPSFHFVADRTHWLDPALRSKRDLLVLLWTMLLMLLAILRQRHLERGLQSLVRERREIEDNLKSSEKDLRLLVERTRVGDRLRAAEERFTKAFEVSPDALVLSSFDDGTILDVNPAFERLSLLSRAVCVGRRSSELGLWPFPERRARLIQLLRRRQQMHDLPGELRRADGRVRGVRASYERIQEKEGDVLLTVLRDAGIGAGSLQDRIASLLENTRVPLRLVRAEGPGGAPVTVFVNASARLALRQDRHDFEVAGGRFLRLLLHLPEEKC